ncbi:MAG: hydrogenase maturation nickel metallochaperone HypA, partial [Thermoplasmatota archaeon]
MSQVVEALLRELDERFGPGGSGSEERGGAGARRAMGGGGAQLVRVESVVLEVGEMTMLAEEPLKFAWSALTRRGPLKGARLKITSRPVILECPGCGYRGRGRPLDASADHLALPALSCPSCGGEVRFVGGRECVVREMRAVVDDGGAGGGGT